MRAKLPQRADLLIGFLLLVVTLCVYARVGRYEFVGLDDPQYVAANPRVQAGLSWHGLTWAFRTSVQGSWVPLTLISHMMAWQVFGPWAGGHHAVNVALHLANVLLLYCLLRLATRTRWRSAYVAALFAIHPLHVESVAWVSERKDVLSTAFWLATLIAYVRYVRRPSRGRYLVIVAAFAAGLLSKATLVTLPLVLLLLDYWPLRRVRGEGRSDLRLLVEKLPLLAMSAVASVLAFAAQPDTVTTISGVYSWTQRAGNAINSYALYVARCLWPARLAAYYPFPAEVRGVALSASWLAVASLAALLAARRRPYLTVGWLWFLGTLVPVIGFVQQGEQALADRYAYVPLMGLYVALAWLMAELAERIPKARVTIAACAAASVVALALVAAGQVGFWRDEVALYTRTLDVTRDNYVIQNNLGAALGARGRISDAVPHLSEALRLRPNYTAAGTNLDHALGILETRGAADSLDRDALADACLRSGLFHESRHDSGGAEARFQQALRAKPGWPPATQGLTRLRAGGARDTTTVWVPTSGILALGHGVPG